MENNMVSEIYIVGFLHEVREPTKSIKDVFYFILFQSFSCCLKENASKKL